MLILGRYFSPSPVAPGAQFVVRGMLAASDAAAAGGMELPVPESVEPMPPVPVPEPVPMLELEPMPEPVVPVPASGVGVVGAEGDGVMGAELLAGSPGLVRSQALRASADTTTRGAAIHQRVEVRDSREEVMEGSLYQRGAANRRWSRDARCAGRPLG